MEKNPIKNEIIKSLEENIGSVTFEEIYSEVKKQTYEIESDHDFGEDLVVFENNIIHFRADSFYVYFYGLTIWPDPKNDNSSIYIDDEETLYLISKADKEELQKLKLILTDVQLMYLISFSIVLVGKGVIG